VLGASIGQHAVGGRREVSHPATTRDGHTLSEGHRGSSERQRLGIERLGDQFSVANVDEVTVSTRSGRSISRVGDVLEQQTSLVGAQLSHPHLVLQVRASSHEE
jgi:hypothetical protein